MKRASTVSTDAAVIEYPLSIAPALADFAAMDTGTPPQYVLDYILTANNLVSKVPPGSGH